jgi:hypothetical protein
VVPFFFDQRTQFLQLQVRLSAELLGDDSLERFFTTLTLKMNALGPETL